jgi:hypothetical protein
VVAVPITLIKQPIPLVNFLLSEVQSRSVFLVFFPGAVVVSHSIVVVVDPLAFLDSHIEEPIVDFSVGEHINALAVEEVVAPGAEVDVGLGIGIVAFAFAGGEGVDLANVEAAVGIGDFDYVLEGFDALKELCPLHVVVAEHFVLLGIVLTAKSVHDYLYFYPNKSK